MPIGEGEARRWMPAPDRIELAAAAVELPAVRGETRFALQWVEDETNVLGVTEIAVFPTNLLAELATLGRPEPVGVLDPTGLIQAALQAQGVGTFDLDTPNWDPLPLRLAILGPFASDRQMREAFRGHNPARLAESGAGVIWLQPPPSWGAPLTPSFYRVSLGKGAVVVAEGGLVAALPESPRAQVNLVQLARQAVRPAPMRLPSLEP
jgi:hypothetical protein